MNFHGWLNIDKPKGFTSNDVVQKIKRLLGKQNKIGHAGTLDPLAEGVLPIAIGEATKTVQYIVDATKEYEFDVTFGESRSTGDAEGQVILRSDYIPNIQEIKSVLPQFIGQIKQTPSVYSAIKINGSPAYKLAREGKTVEMPVREVTISNLEIVNDKENVVRFRVNCGKGTYVRSLAEDMAKSLGSCGYVSYLRRTKVGDFLSADAIMLAKLINLGHNAEIKNYLLPVNFGLGDILAVEVSEEEALALRQGKGIYLSSFENTSEMLIQISLNKVLQAIAKIDKGQIKPLRVFNLLI